MSSRSWHCSFVNQANWLCFALLFSFLALFSVGAAGSSEGRQENDTADVHELSPRQATTHHSLQHPRRRQALNDIQYNALSMLFSGASGSGWKNHSGWLSTQSSTVCGWYGVTCNDALAVVSIRLSGNNLVGTIATEIGFLTSLTRLWLSSNKLTSTIPTQIGALTSLTEIDLYRNDLRGRIPSEMGGLSSLKAVKLNSNGLSGTIPSSICDLTALRTLYLYNNQLTGSIPECIGNIGAALHNFGLYSNLLTGVVPPSIGNCTQLRLLYFNDNYISSSLPASLGQLSLLAELHADTNLLSGPLPSTLGNLKELRRLHLNSNKFSSSIPSAIGIEFTKLIELALHSNEISSFVPAALYPLFPQLSLFSIHSNRLTGTVPPQFGQLTKLSSLDISNNAFSGTLPSAILGSNTPFSRLDVSNNRLVGTLPIGLASAPLLASVNVGGNPWNVDLQDFVFPFLYRVGVLDAEEGSIDHGRAPFQCLTASGFACVSMQSVNIDNTLLTGSIPGSIVAADIAQLSLESNPLLTGTLPLATTVTGLDIGRGYLQDFTARFTSFSIAGCPGVGGAIDPSWGSLSSNGINTLTFMNLTGTSMRSWSGGVSGDAVGSVHANELPPFITPTKQVHVYSTGETHGTRPIRCPVMTMNDGLTLLDIAPDYFGWYGCDCNAGDALVKPGVCVDCPLGGNCSNGSAFASEPGFWCSIDPEYGHGDGDADHQIACYSCPLTAGEVCPGGNVPIGQCVQGRTGVLCGACVANTTVTLNEAECVPNTECKAWAVPTVVTLVVIGTLIVALTFVWGMRADHYHQPLLSWRHDRSSARGGPLDSASCQLETVFVSLGFYYQILPLVSNDLSRLSSALPSTAEGGANFGNLITSTFNVHFSGIGHFKAGLCVWADLTPVKKLVLQYCIPMLLLLWIAALAALTKISMYLRTSSANTTRADNHDDNHNKNKGFWSFLDGQFATPFGNHVRGLLSMSTLAYSTVLQTTLQLLNCVRVGTNQVLAVSGTVVCLQVWQKALYSVVPLLVLAPIALVLYARRWRHDTLSPQYSSLLLPYSQWYWIGMMLLQRLVMVLIYIYVDGVPRSATLFACTFLLLCLNVIARPFATVSAVIVNTVLLAMLTILAGFNATASALLNKVSPAIVVETVAGVNSLAHYLEAVKVIPALMGASLFVVLAICRNLPFVQRRWLENKIVILVSIGGRGPFYGRDDVIKTRDDVGVHAVNVIRPSGDGGLEGNIEERFGVELQCISSSDIAVTAGAYDLNNDENKRQDIGTHVDGHANVASLNVRDTSKDDFVVECQQPTRIGGAVDGADDDGADDDWVAAVAH